MAARLQQVQGELQAAADTQLALEQRLAQEAAEKQRLATLLCQVARCGGGVRGKGMRGAEVQGGGGGKRAAGHLTRWHIGSAPGNAATSGASLHCAVDGARAGCWYAHSSPLRRLTRHPACLSQVHAAMERVEAALASWEARMTAPPPAPTPGPCGEEAAAAAPVAPAALIAASGPGAVAARVEAALVGLEALLGGAATGAGVVAQSAAALDQVAEPAAGLVDGLEGAAKVAQGAPMRGGRGSGSPSCWGCWHVDSRACPHHACAGPSGLLGCTIERCRAVLMPGAAW